MAKGLDCGTSFYITATEDKIQKQRNAFLTVEGDSKTVTRMLKRQRIPYVEKGGKIHIVGHHAFNYAQIFSQTELRRPMKSGLLNPGESFDIDFIITNNSFDLDAINVTAAIENDGDIRYLNRITSILALEIWYRIFIKKDLNPKKNL